MKTNSFTKQLRGWNMLTSSHGLLALGLGLAVHWPGGVQAWPNITTQPASRTILYGQRATVAVVATGTDVTYQWYTGLQGDTSLPIANATNASFTTPGLFTNASYWVRVTDYGGSMDSDSAAVTVGAHYQLYRADFESLNVGVDGWIGFEQWEGEPNGVGAYGVLAAGDSGGLGRGKCGWIGKASSMPQDYALVWRPLSYDPIGHAHPVVIFSVDFNIHASSPYKPNYDWFAFEWYNRSNGFMASLILDTSDHQIFHNDNAGGDVLCGTFNTDQQYHLWVAVNYQANTWSAMLDNTVLFTNITFNGSSSFLDLGDIDVSWNLAVPRTPGDNYMALDNYAVASVVPVTVPPALSSPRRLANGQFQFVLTGEPGSNVEILASTNLTSWAVWHTANNILATNVITWIRRISTMEKPVLARGNGCFAH